MTITIIRTGQIPFRPDSAGSSAEVLNRELCGATYSHGTLRLLESNEQLNIVSDPPMHQVIYVLEGDGAVTIDASRYEITKGGGIYLAPFESAKIAQKGAGPLKLFHLTVPNGGG